MHCCDGWYLLLSRSWPEVVVEFILVAVTYTHLWINNSNEFVKVCTYKENVTRPNRLYDKQFWIYPDLKCPLKKNLKR